MHRQTRSHSNNISKYTVEKFTSFNRTIIKNLFNYQLKWHIYNCQLRIRENLKNNLVSKGN